jgi:Nucleotidyltransferase/DNA polymerase involved in DNA repair
LIKKTKNTDIQFCRDCLHQTKKLSDLCGKCLSPRVINHKELKNLSIAHIDCDAFYASVEKRDNADLKNKPLIIGGGDRRCSFHSLLYCEKQRYSLLHAYF